jgi:hypothetical protein
MITLATAACGGPLEEGSGGAGSSPVAGGGTNSTSSNSTSSNSTSSNSTSSNSTSSNSTSSNSTSSNSSSSSSGNGTGLAALSDEFDGDGVDDAWTIVNGDRFEHMLGGGELHLRPTTNTLWFDAEATGALLYKTVTGNFKLTTAVKARRASNPSQPVGPTDYQFGGIMARAPNAAQENYVFVVVGDRGPTIQTETKSTTNGASSVKGDDWPSGDAQLRLCRVGSMFHMYARPYDGGTWAIATQWGPPYDRADLPETMQVGTIAYAWTNTPDLRASFDYVRFEPADSEADCTTD